SIAFDRYVAALEPLAPNSPVWNRVEADADDRVTRIPNDYVLGVVAKKRDEVIEPVYVEAIFRWLVLSVALRKRLWQISPQDVEEGAESCFTEQGPVREPPCHVDDRETIRVPRRREPFEARRRGDRIVLRIKHDTVRLLRDSASHLSGELQRFHRRSD